MPDNETDATPTSEGDTASVNVRPPGTGPGTESVTHAPGTMIGPYRILQLLGEGGFGTVYLAEQLAPITRRVALKIIKVGMESRHVIARFEAERQALALMNHPNIARVLDANTTPDHRPYFVMELVKGVPITEYCDGNALSTRERLDLFRDVCHAVQHAHTKGIIHRDIKPSNVLVTLADDRPMVKVIDFGIAKATDRQLTEKTLFTDFGLFLGTPEYMSPEQAELTSLDIDTRSDIYSLGVLAYELLTGKTPFDRRRLRSAGYAEIQRIIREEEPPKPSTRLSRSAPVPGGEAKKREDESSLNDIARHRRTDPPGLISSIRGELDWIIMKALEKDRARRYETAKDLADDIERHLVHEPVQAGPPSPAYRFAKFARRHRVLLSTTSAVAAALVIGFGIAVYGFINASRERDEKQLALSAAQAARSESEAVTTFLSDMLAAVNPAQDGQDVRVVDVLDQASSRIGTEIGDRPMVEARLRHTMGVTYRTLGALDAAERQLLAATQIRRRVLGDDDADTLDSMSNLAEVYANLGRFDEAADLYADTLEVQQGVLGRDHVDTVDTRTSLGTVFLFQERYDDAEPLLREALESARRTLGQEHEATLTALNNLGGMYYQLGRLQDAEPLFRESFEARRRTLGDDHPETLLSMENLASLLDRLGRDAESESTFREAIALARRKLGNDHVTTARFLNDFAGFLRKRDRCEEAEPLYVEALQFFEREYPARFYYTGFVLTGQGSCLAKFGRFKEAESALVTAYEILDEAGGRFARRKTTAIEAIVELYELWDKPRLAAEWRARLPTGS